MADTSESSGSAARPVRPRRWWRRVVWTGGIGAGLFGAAGVAGWMWRVEVLNRALAGNTGPWKVEIAHLDRQTGGGFQLRGITVRHPGAEQPVVEVAEATTSAGWTDLMAGRLGTLRLQSPVLRWVDGLTGPDDPAAAQPAGKPLISWEHLVLTDGTLSVVTGEPDAFSLTAGVDWQGGAATVYDDGTLTTETQTLSLTDPRIHLRAESGALAELRLKAAAAQAEVALDHAARHLAVASLTFREPELDLTGRLAGAATGPAMAGEGAADPWLRSLEIAGSRIPSLALRASWPLAPGAPPLTVRAAGDFGVRGFRWEDAGAATATAVTVDTRELDLGGGLQITSVKADASLTEDGLRIPHLSLTGGAVRDLRALLAAAGLPEKTLQALPSAAGSLELSLTDLALTADGPRSGAVQLAVLRDVDVSVPGTGRVTSGEVRIAAVPDEIFEGRRVRELHIQSPQISLAPEPAPLTEEPAAPAGPTESGPPAWEGWTVDALTITPGTVAVTLPELSGAQLTAGLRADTLAPENEDSRLWQLTLDTVRLVHPDWPDAPSGIMEKLVVKATPEGLWQRREVSAVDASGVRVEVGDALFHMLGLSNAAPDNAVKQEAGKSAAPAGAAVPPPSNPWRVVRATLRDTQVALHDLGDGSRLEIPVKDLTFTDLPLDASALASVDQVYKVEVPNITIYSPFTEGQKVAVLDTNYIQFSPSGILARRLERVDLMLPTLYAGTPLFDYIDACRQRFEALAENPAAAPGFLLAATDAPASAEAAAALAALQRAGAQPDGWVVPLYTASGRVIVAPKGNPWPDFPVIPFRNARTPDGKPVPFLLNGTEFHGELAVEPGWYEFPEFKLSLRISDKGRIVFNFPSSDQDSNLVEIFKDNTIIYKQLRVDGVWLSVTYDDNGIYARFGGELAGGNLAGGVNLYLDELYTWDGWVSLTGAAMKVLTEKLSPGTLTMEGTLDEVTLKAYGDMTTLYQVIGDLKVSQPGHLRIDAIEELKEKMADLEPLSRDLAAIGVDTLRDFYFTSCAGTLRLFGTEGKATLRLAGDAGSRNFTVNLHDYRAKLPKSLAPF